MACSPEAQVIVPQQLKSLHPQKIGVVRRNGLGDLLMTQPLLRWCRLQLGARITLVVDSRNIECAEWIANPPWDELLIMPPGNKYMSALLVASKLRKLKLDLLISAKPKPMKLMNLLLAFSGAKWRRAVVHENLINVTANPIDSDLRSVSRRTWLDRLLECTINWPLERSLLENYPHQAQQVLRLAAEGPCTIDPSLFPRMKAAPLDFVEEFERDIKREGFSNRPRLYINFSNNRATSRLSLEQLKLSLIEVGQPLDLIIGAMANDKIAAQVWANELKQELGWQVAQVVGAPLPLTLAALQQSDLILTGDGGLMHIAAACDKPLLALFGQTSIERWRPLSTQAESLYHEESVDLIDPHLIARLIQSLLRLRESK